MSGVVGRVVEKAVEPPPVHPGLWPEGRERVLRDELRGEILLELQPLGHVIVVSPLHRHSFVAALSLVTDVDKLVI